MKCLPPFEFSSLFFFPPLTKVGLFSREFFSSFLYFPFYIWLPTNILVGNFAVSFSRGF